MTHPRLSISAMSSFRWSFDRDFALWSDVGAAWAGLLISKLGDDPQAKMGRLSAAGIRASTLITECFDLSAPASWEATRANHRAAIDLVADHDGRSIYFTPGRTTGLSWNEDLDRLADAIAPTIAYARTRGIVAALEPTLLTSASFVTTLRDAVDVAERTGASLVADFANIWMERDLRDVLRAAMPHIALMQINDIVIGGRGRPAPGGRVHIGDGELPLRRLMQDVLDAGYDGPFDLEVVGPDFRADVEESALRRGIEKASALLEELGL